MKSRTRLSVRRLRRAPRTYNNAACVALLMSDLERFGEDDFNAKVAAWDRGEEITIGSPISEN